MNQETPKHQRMQVVLDYLHSLPPASNALEAYLLIEKAIMDVEDIFLGKESYNPPKTFLDGTRTERIYMTLHESIHPVPKYGGVQILVHAKEVVFISRYGAIEMQRKHEDDKHGFLTPFEKRNESVLFKKNDAYGDGVWHQKNK